MGLPFFILDSRLVFHKAPRVLGCKTHLKTRFVTPFGKGVLDVYHLFLLTGQQWPAPSAHYRP